MKYISAVFLMIALLTVHAQKNDYVWLSGYGSRGGCGISPDGCFGINVIDFNYPTAQVSYDSLAVQFRSTNTSYCDNLGALLFYTNGRFTYNMLGEMIEGSDTLNPGYGQQYWGERGYDLSQGIIALPFPGQDNNYMLLHAYADTANGGWYPGAKSILSTKLDMNANGNRGKVVYKNQMVFQGAVSETLSATRHGNGRDWWIFCPRRDGTCPYRFLLDGTGVYAVNPPYCQNEHKATGILKASCFSPDGTKYIYVDEDNGTSIYDFDRCTGVLSEPANISNGFEIDTLLNSMGVAVSPSSRYLYVLNSRHIFQYDLYAGNIAASLDTVAVFDGYKDPFNSTFGTAQLAPDGKIYISSPNSETNYTVIENPDEGGVLCNVNQHSLQLPSFGLGVPNFPNYRLAGLAQSACDTLTGIEDLGKRNIVISAYPNPASSRLIVQYDGIDWQAGNVHLQIVNSIGQVINEHPLPMYSAYQSITIEDLSYGIYTLVVKQNNGVINTLRIQKY